MWDKIAGIILRNRITALIIIGLITIFMGYKALDVKMSYEYARLLPENDTTNINYEYFKSVFGEEANVFIFGFTDTNFFQLEKFNDYYELGDSINNIPEISGVLSVGQALNLYKDKDRKEFKTEKIFKSKPTTQKELDSLATLLKGLPFYKNSLYSNDDVYLMAISLSGKVLDTKERIPLVTGIKALIDKFGEKHQLKLHYSGLPYIRTAISQKIKSELNMFIILALLVCSIIMFIFFKSYKVVIFSLLIVGIAVIWALGFMAIFNYRVTILTGMIPPLLIVIGIPNSIFMLNKYISEYRNHKNQIKALQRVIRKVGNAIFLTNLTTACGFATFILTSSEILIEFGIIAFINIMGLFLLSLIMIPSIYSFLSPPEEKHSKHLDNKLTNRVVSFLIKSTFSSRPVIYTITIVTLAFAAWGITKITNTGYMVDDIPHDDPVYVDLKYFEEHFNGVLPLEILIDTKKKKGVLSLSTLNKIETLQDSLSTYPELSASISPVNGIKFASQAFYNGSKSKYKLPSSMDKNFILSYIPKKTDNNKLLNAYLDTNKQITRISLQMQDVGTDKMQELLPKILNDIEEVLPPEKYKTILTGPGVVFFKGATYLVKNLFVSLGLAIMLIAAFMAWMFKSFRMVMVSIIPNLIPLLVTAAIMGFTGIPVKPSTILVFSIAFGISVDDTIHFLAKYRQELTHHNWDIRKSVKAALSETGFSMMHTSIVLFFGFSIFDASSFGGTVALGLLVSITLLVAMLSNLVLLPTLLLTLEKHITTKAFKEPLIQIFNEEEDIEISELKIQHNNDTDS